MRSRRYHPLDFSSRHAASAYAQDQWNAGRATLNIGLRYQYQKGLNQQLNINDTTMFPTTAIICTA